MHIPITMRNDVLCCCQRLANFVRPFDYRSDQFRNNEFKFYFSKTEYRQIKKKLPTKTLEWFIFQFKNSRFLNLSSRFITDTSLREISTKLLYLETIHIFR